MTEQIHWRAKEASQVACFSEDLKWWGAWDTTRGHKAKDHTINRLEERGVERGNARRSSLKGREKAIVLQTNIGTFSKATLGETSERRDGAHIGFSERIDTILNWTEQGYTLVYGGILRRQT